MRKALLMMDLGTLQNMVREEKYIQRIKDFKGLKLIYTGWDFTGHGKRYAEIYNADAIVCESSILYTKPEEGWERRNAEPGRSLFSDEDLKIVKELNYKLLGKIYENEPESVLLSQADEKGICYYINPPDWAREGLNEFTSKEEVKANTFKKFLLNGAPEFPELKDTIHVIDEKSLELPDGVESRYLVEKTNAKYRAFRPYSLKIENGKLKLFLDAEQRKNWEFSDIENLVQNLWNKGLGVLSMSEYLRVAPQTDICIDIFPRTKRQTWREAIDKANLGDFDCIFYLTRKTESDIPLIVDAYRVYGDCFFSLGPDDMPSGLKRIGVIPKKTIGEILKFIELKIGAPPF